MINQIQSKEFVFHFPPSIQAVAAIKQNKMKIYLEYNVE